MPYIPSPDQKRRARARERLYNMERGEYSRRLGQQGYCCAICGVRHREDARLVVDHDHATGVVRGLLCKTCNTAIGMLRDDVLLVQAAMSYLAGTTDVSRDLRKRLRARQRREQLTAETGEGQ